MDQLFYNINSKYVLREICQSASHLQISWLGKRVIEERLQRYT